MIAAKEYVVTYPATPGGKLTGRCFSSLESARTFARVEARRPDILHFNVRIEDTDGNLVEYGDGTGAR